VKAIRPLYDALGPTTFYALHGKDYQNPHEPQIHTLIRQNAHRIPKGNVLDFAAGTGEVTRALSAIGVDCVGGIDPYTSETYASRTGKACLSLSFLDIIRQGLPARYEAIISAFALHLCPRSDLYLLTWQLLQAAPQLIVITPHKRPELELLPGIQLEWEDDTQTDRGKFVRIKSYKLQNYPNS